MPRKLIPPTTYGGKVLDDVDKKIWVRLQRLPKAKQEELRVQIEEIADDLIRKGRLAEIRSAVRPVIRQEITKALQLKKASG